MTTTEPDARGGAGEFKLASDFAKPGMDKWREAAAKVLNRGRPEDKLLTGDQAVARLVTTTVDGVEIAPIYTLEDAPKELGYPGVAPFTRGTTVHNGEADAWDVRALHEDPDAAFTSQAVLTDLERGASSLWFRVDPDAIKAEDLARTLEGVLLELITVEVSSRTDQEAAAEALLQVLDASDKPRNHKSAVLGLDPIGLAALNGTTPELGALAEWVKKLDGMRSSRAIVVDATIWHNAGAGDVHELGYALATGAEYVRALIDQGLTPDQAFDAIDFRVTATVDQFATIARLRALRTCWSKVGEVFGVSEAKRGARQHAVTSWREVTRDDAYVNMLRGTMSTFAAGIGGAEAITVLPFDTAWGLPGDFSRRIARNTQVILAEESNIVRVNDPAGGSWYVESLTKKLAEAGWAVFGKLEAAGGMAKAVVDGLAKTELEPVIAERAKRLATRKKPITGVSEFPNIEELDVTTARPRPEAPAFAGLEWHRDSEVFEAMRDAVKAQPNASVFLACLGQRRDFGAREGFAGNLFHVAGLPTPKAEGGSTEEIVAAFKQAGTPVACLCSNAKVYAEQALPVAKALKEAGAKTVYLAGNLKELGEGASEAEGVIDGTVALGVDVVTLLGTTLDTLGVSK
ncbi:MULTISPECIES: methylmalonyl-CoA mutase small subunit [unclassified Luteococcus]|uniref:methylmalonyl-CoA mutase small subunit n=1 Tax=unclassified Luteococcus TaxID=2639923 RepID=UPI00313E40D4